MVYIELQESISRKEPVHRTGHTQSGGPECSWLERCAGLQLWDGTGRAQKRSHATDNVNQGFNTASLEENHTASQEYSLS